MLKFDVYAICVEIDERRSVDKELFLSFDEAMKSRMKYNNWWRPKGDIWIKKYENGFPYATEEWHINEKGEIDRYFDWKKEEG